MTTLFDPVESERRFDAAEDADDAYRVDQTTTVTLYDKFKEVVGYEHNYESIQAGWKVNAAGGLKMLVPRVDMLPEIFDHLFRNPDGEDATIPITVGTAAKRWDGYVTRIALIADEDGTERVDIEAIHCWQHVATTAFYPSPFAPIWAQWPRHMVIIAPVVTLAATYFASNWIRSQSSVYPEQWSDAPDWARNGGSAMWPIALIPVQVFTDTSVWRAGSARMDMADKFLEPLLAGTGVMVEMSFYLPSEDDPQPAPEYYQMDRPTVVCRIRNDSGTTGPTGTLIDGIISWFEEWVDDTTLVRYPNFNATTEYEEAYEYAGPFGSINQMPHVWYRRGEYSGLGASEIALHKPQAIDVIVGGKSPGWVNAAIDVAISNLLAWLGLLIGLPGLDSLYRGQLDDVFLAWAVWRDNERARRAGPFAFRELYVAGSDKAFTLDGVMAGRKGQHDTRGYTSHRITVIDVAPYRIGHDFDLNSQIGVDLGEAPGDVDRGFIFTDRVTEMTFTDDAAGARWELVIGDGEEDEDSVTRAWSQMGRMAGAIKDLFTDVGADLDLIIF